MLVALQTCARLVLTAVSIPSQSNGWSTRGMGTLQLRRPLDASAGASARLILRNDNTGKAMLNAKLYSGMKLVIKEGKSICTSVFNVVAPAAPVGGAAEDSQAAAPAGGAAEDSQPAAKPEPLIKHVMTCVRGVAGAGCDLTLVLSCLRAGCCASRQTRTLRS